MGQALFRYGFNGNLEAKYSNPHQMLMYAEEAGVSEVKLYHEIPKKYYEQASKESCLRFRSVYSTRLIEGHRGDHGEMRPSLDSLHQSRLFWRDLANGVPGLNVDEIEDIGASLHFEKKTESKFHWIHCWSTSKPTIKNGYVILETSLKSLCSQLKYHPYVANNCSLGEFRLGFVHYICHEFGNDLIEDIFVKKPCWDWEQEFRICFVPSSSYELALREYLVGNIEERHGSFFLDGKGDIKEFLEINLNFEKFTLS